MAPNGCPGLSMNTTVGTNDKSCSTIWFQLGIGF